MEVIKRNKEVVDFKREKIETAIEKAMHDLNGIFVDGQAREISEEIEKELKEMNKTASIYDIEELVFFKLVEKGNPATARAYESYKSIQTFKRKINTTDTPVLELLQKTNSELMEENSNKNPMIASTQRDLIAGEVSKDIAKRKLLSQRLVDAHESGAIHIHDLDYLIQPIFNCCLVNMKDMLDNGTVVNGKMIEQPKSFQVACNVMTQIIAQIASNQYGGQSIEIDCLGKYLRKSYEKNLELVSGTTKDLESAVELAKTMTQKDLESGVQTIQYQINTLMTSNGQAPFVTLFLYLKDDDEYKEETALIIEEILKQRIQGIKNEKGVYTTPAFPKLVYVLDENNVHDDSEYKYLTNLAIRCTAKRLYPDYISAKKMKANYEGNVFSPMGCLEGDEIPSVMIDDNVLVTSFEELYNNLSQEIHPIDYRENKIINNMDLENIDALNNQYTYIDLESKNIKTYDTRNNKYVKVNKLIRNMTAAWYKVTLDKLDNSINFTDNHVHIVERNNEEMEITSVELQVGDIIKLTQEKGQEPDTSVVKNIEIEKLDKPQYSYDFETETGSFDVSGINTHNCRAFLPPYKDDHGKYKFEGRFNMGVCTINLPQIGILAQGDEDKFFELLNKRLELVKEVGMFRYKHLKEVTSDVSPIHWRHGAIARLGQGEKIGNLLKGGYATVSIGYIGIYETCISVLGKSNTTKEGKEFAKKILKVLNEKKDQWTEETGIQFAVYGTPAESLCYRFAKIDEERFGEIENVTDKGYYTNSFHVDVREEINAFEKFKIESEFQDLSLGGCISYVEIPNMMNNLPALETLIKYIYNNIQYAEFNTKSDYCMECGFDGEIKVNEDGDWECPQCGNKDRQTLSVVRRTCGYLGENFWNKGKTKEISERVLHI